MNSLWNPSKESYQSEQYQYDQDRRQEIFDKIAPKDNWKYPIDAWINEEDFADCNQAAIYFTGSQLTIVDKVVKGLGCIRVRVTAPGYYNTIGA